MAMHDLTVPSFFFMLQSYFLSLAPPVHNSHCKNQAAIMMSLAGIREPGTHYYMAVVWEDEWNMPLKKGQATYVHVSLAH